VAGSGVTEILKAAAALPTFVTVKCTGLVTDPGPTQPKDTVAGATVAPGASVAAAFNFHAPTAAISGSPESELPAMSLGLTLAVFTSADLICAAENPGFACFTSAAAPATMAAAKLDPCTVV
jgi:hypothetical protein